jgi:hypothetical protein
MYSERPTMMTGVELLRAMGALSLLESDVDVGYL